MPEPVEMPNIEAIVESIRVARRSEEGARMHIAVSVQVKDAPQLLPFLATSLKNVIKVGFTEIQARLPENPAKPPATETVKTTVDGVEANVVLTKSRRNGHRADPDALAAQGDERHQAMLDAAKSPHTFVRHAKDNQCGACGQGDGAAVHEVDEALPDDAQALIDAASETEAVPSA